MSVVIQSLNRRIAECAQSDAFHEAIIFEMETNSVKRRFMSQGLEYRKSMRDEENQTEDKL